MANEKAQTAQLIQLHEIVQAGEDFREEAKTAIGHFLEENSQLREYANALYDDYAVSVNNHREVSIACDHILDCYTHGTDTIVKDEAIVDEQLHIIQNALSAEQAAHHACQEMLHRTEHELTVYA